MPNNAADAQNLLQFTLEYGGSIRMENLVEPNPGPGLSELDLNVRKTALTCFAVRDHSEKSMHSF